MPATPQTASLRGNCTRIVERLTATGLAICRAGSVVALHVATQTGEVIVTVDEPVFVTAARGPRDHNGNPWREASELNPKGERVFSSVILNDHATVPVTRNARSVVQPVPRENLGLEAVKHAAVQVRKNGGSPLTYGQLCQEAGCTYRGFMNWRASRGFSEPQKNKRSLTA